MSTISGSQASQLTRANKANQQIALGTIIQDLGNIQTMRSGSMLVYALHTNASAIALTTEVASSKGYIVTIFRSGSLLYHTAYAATVSGSLTLTPNAGYTITLADKVFWIQY